MTNNERFNAMLNSCQHPRAVLQAISTPNFLRLAQDLNKFKDPYKAADTLLAGKEGGQHE